MPDQDYKNEMQIILNDPVYKILKTNPTRKIERKTILIKKSGIPDDTARKLSPHGAVPPRIYGLPKIHKADVPLRPIVNCISSPTYGLAKHLAGQLKPLTGNSILHIKNSEAFVQKLQNMQLQETDLMVSFDITSLFTKVPTEDTADTNEAYSSKHDRPNQTHTHNHLLPI
jgi:hypothetical protein